jgi:acetyl-CoA carboxylase biotin carboxyl carrier protein
MRGHAGVNDLAELKVLSDLNAKVWQIEVAVGDAVDADATLMVLESMKTEIPVDAPRAGTVKAILVAEGDPVEEGQAVVLLEV